MGLLPREQRLVEAIVDVAGSVESRLDVPELLYTLAATSVDLLDVETAAVQLVDDRGALDTVAICGRNGRSSGLFGDDVDDGPGVASYRQAEVVSSSDVTLDGDRWPAFTAQALRLGFRSVHGIPMRCRDQVVGALTLARTRVTPPAEADLAIAQCLATVATLTIVHDRAQHTHALVRKQLEEALESRIIIEQAKGYLARSHDETPDLAFTRLRAHARSRGRRLAAVAEDVMTRGLELA
ncbi:GAF and ANTAR domain-containing protein [Actinomycetospora sp.]|uniref:GAF and ANTAR domain-containing protein n=1 Tax=Actinomycetospora sp. TaxID=1872135 RepID=UPI002F4228C2